MLSVSTRRIQQNNQQTQEWLSYLRMVLDESDVLRGEGERLQNIVKGSVHIGWRDADFVYIRMPKLSPIIKNIARRANKPLSISTIALYRRLDALGVIARRSSSGNTTVLKTDGKCQRVLMLYRHKIES